jgi:hypothetical protein
MEQPWNTVRDAIPDVLEGHMDPGDAKFETAKLVRNWNLWLITVAAAICALLWQPLQTANHFPRPAEYWFLLLGWMSFCFAILIAMLLVATLPAIIERLAAAHYERIRVSHRSLYGRLAFLHRVPLQHAFFVLGVVSTMLFVAARPPAGQANMVRAAFTPIRIRCGGPAFTDAVLHQVWTADRNFSGGSTFKTPNAVTVSSPGEGGLYQSQRYGSFRYDFPVPYGTYVLNLKFAEIWYTEPEKRIFDVIVNGETVLPNFDIIAQAGGPNIAVDRSFIVGPTTLITIEWKPRVDNAEVNAIEILEQPASVREPAPPQTSRGWRGFTFEPHHLFVVKPNV